MAGIGTRLWRTLLITAAVLALVAAGAAGCGSSSNQEATAQLDKALGSYQDAVQKVDKIDIKKATESEITAARKELSAAWSDVKKWSEKAGQETSAVMTAAQQKLNGFLVDVGNATKTGMKDAAQAVQKAVDTLKGGLQTWWDDIKKLL